MASAVGAERRASRRCSWQISLNVSPSPPSSLGTGRKQIFGLTQLLEVFEEEAVLPVVDRGSLGETGEHFLRKNRVGSSTGSHFESPWLEPGIFFELTRVQQIARPVILAKRLSQHGFKPPCRSHGRVSRWNILWEASH